MNLPIHFTFKHRAAVMACAMSLIAIAAARGQCTDSGCDGLSENTFIGIDALNDNETGTSDTAVGRDALFSNETGIANTAVGANALSDNDNGGFNTALGTGTMASNISGSQNAVVGALSMSGNYAGKNNVAVGYESLYNSQVGNLNVAAGSSALLNTTGNSNIGLGASAGTNLTSGSNNIDIGNAGVAAEANTIRIGTQGTQTTTFIAGIRGAVLTQAVAVGVNADGQLGVRASSARFKEAIRPMDKSSEVILALKPVTFRYKKALDPKGAPEFGLVAEDVAKVDRDLVVSDEKGKPFSVRYEEVNAMLLNEFLKEHRQVADLKSIVARQEKAIALLNDRMERQAAQTQRVAAGF
jgi:hypothetical protein